MNNFTDPKPGKHMEGCRCPERRVQKYLHEQNDSELIQRLDMAVKRYKIGFRVDADGALNLLWDAGEMVHASDYDRLEVALRKIAGTRETGLSGDEAWEYVKIAREALGLTNDGGTEHG